MLAVGSSTPLVHLCLGTDAILRDDYDLGAKHLQLAYQADPSLVAAANNLAWAMSFADPPRLNEGLALIDSVLKRQPDLAPVRETRGQILLKLGRAEEAITELEFALRTMQRSEVTRQALITAYRQIGMDAMAEEQVLVLERLKGE